MEKLDNTTSKFLNNIESIDDINGDAMIFWTKYSKGYLKAFIWDQDGIKPTSLSISAEEYEEEREKRLLINKEEATIAILGKKPSGNFFLSQIFEMNDGVLEAVENDFRAIMVFREKFPDYELQTSGYIVNKNASNLARQKRGG